MNKKNNAHYYNGVPKALFDKFDETPSDDIFLPLKNEIARILNARDVFKGYDIEGVVSNFGMPEFATVCSASEESIDAFLRECEARILRYEPRVDDVTATLVAFDAPQESVTLQISARLRLRPVREPVAFETAMRLP